MARSEKIAPGAEMLERLFASIAEELKLPLQQIARRAELEQLQIAKSTGLQHIQTAADMSLQLLDNYLLSLRLMRDPESAFAVQPVSVSAVLHDARERLTPLARSYGVELEMEIAAKYEPVMAHRLALTSAMVSLGYSLIEALPATGTRQMRLQLAAHRTKYGIVAGMYCDVENLTPQALRRGQMLQGQARQPLVGVLPNAGGGVFVADAILGAMDSKLRVGRYHKMPGFAATFAPSHQLQLV